MTTTRESEMNDPSKRVIKSRLVVSCYGNKVRDSRETQAVNLKYGVASGEEIGLVDRHILLKEALDPIYKAERLVRNAHKRFSVPYADGSRLILLSRFTVWSEGMNEAKRQFADAVDEFLNTFDSWVRKTREKAGAWWDPSLLPERHEMKKKFGVRHVWSQLSFSDFEALGVLDSESRSQVEEEIREQQQVAIQEAVNSVYVEFLEKIQEMAKRMSPETKRVHEKSYKDFEVFVDMIPEFNLNQSPELTKLHAELKGFMREHIIEAEYIREASDHEREELSGKLSKLLEKFQGSPEK